MRQLAQYRWPRAGQPGAARRSVETWRPGLWQWSHRRAAVAAQRLFPAMLNFAERAPVHGLAATQGASHASHFYRACAMGARRNRLRRCAKADLRQTRRNSALEAASGRSAAARALVQGLATGPLPGRYRLGPNSPEAHNREAADQQRRAAFAPRRTSADGRISLRRRGAGGDRAALDPAGVVVPPSAAAARLPEFKNVQADSCVQRGLMSGVENRHGPRWQCRRRRSLVRCKYPSGWGPLGTGLSNKNIVGHGRDPHCLGQRGEFARESGTGLYNRGRHGRARVLVLANLGQPGRGRIQANKAGPRGRSVIRARQLRLEYRASRLASVAGKGARQSREGDRRPASASWTVKSWQKPQEKTFGRAFFRVHWSRCRKPRERPPCARGTQASPADPASPWIPH